MRRILLVALLAIGAFFALSFVHPAVPHQAAAIVVNFDVRAQHVTPSSPASYVQIARSYAAQYGIDPDLFVRQINQESGFNPSVISRAGAIGIAQIMPATAHGWGVNPYDPIQSLRAAAQHMAAYARRYGDYRKALAAYNCGQGCTDLAIARGGAAWLSFVPLETQNYITSIMR